MGNNKKFDNEVEYMKQINSLNNPNLIKFIKTRLTKNFRFFFKLDYNFQNIFYFIVINQFNLIRMINVLCIN